MNYGKLKKLLLETDISKLTRFDMIDLEYSVLKSSGTFNNKLSDDNYLISIYNEMSVENFAKLVDKLNAKVEFDVYSKLDDYRKLLTLEKDYNLIIYTYNKFRKTVEFDSSFYEEIRLDNSYQYYKYIDNKEQFFNDLYQKNYKLFIEFFCKEKIADYCTQEMIDTVFNNLEKYDKETVSGLITLAIEDEKYLNMLMDYDKMNYVLLLANEMNKKINLDFLDNADLEQFVCDYKTLKLNYLDNERFRKFIINKKEFYDCKYSGYTVKEIVKKLDENEKKIFINRLIDTYDELNLEIIDDLKEYLNQNEIYKIGKKFEEQFKDINKAVEIVKQNAYRESGLLADLLNKVEINRYYEILEQVEYDIPRYCLDKLPLERLVVPYQYAYKYGYFKPENIELLRLAVTKEIFYKDINNNALNQFEKAPEDITKVFIENCNKYTDLIKKELKEALYPKKINFIANNISDEEMIKIFDELDNNYGLFMILNNLSDKLKNRLYFEGHLEKKMDINNMMTIDDLTQIATKEIFDDLKTKKEFRYTRLPEIYLKTKRKYLFPEIMRNADKVGYLSESRSFPFSITEEEYNSVSEEYQKIYKESIKNYSAQSFLELYFGNYSEAKPLATDLKKFYNELFEEKILAIDEFDFKISPNYLYFINDKDFEILFKKLPKEDILLLALKYKKFSDELKKELQKNPDYIKDVKITKLDKYKLDEKYISEDIILNNNYLINILNDEQLIVFAQNKYLENNNELLIKIKENILKNPNYMQPNITKYFEDTELNYIFNNIQFIELMKNLILYRKNYPDIKNIINNRIDDIIYYINNLQEYEKNASINDILNLTQNNRMIFSLIDGEKEEFINSITNFDYISKCLYEINIHDVKLQKLLENRIIHLINSNDINFKLSMWYLPIDEKEKKDFLDRINDDKIFNYLLNIIKGYDKKNLKTKFVANYLFERLNNNKEIIINPDIYTLLDELYLYLTEEEKEIINNIIDSDFRKYKNIFEEKHFETIGSKCCYIGLQKNNLINENTISILKELIKHNIHLFQSLDYRILDKDILKLGGYFIEKLSRYPELCSKIILLKNKTPEKFEMFINLINNLDINTNKIVLDTKFVIILDYLINNELKKENYSLSDIEKFILNNHYNKSIKNIDINDFNRNLDEYIDSKMNCDDIKIIQNLVSIKYFGIEKNIINDFIFSYLLEFESIKEFCNDQYVLEYINNILIFNNIDNIEILKNMNAKKYTINDFLIIREKLKELYVESIKKDINKYNKGKEKIINIDDKKYECIDLTDNYGLFVHSTDAYGSMPLLNNNYYDSWNYSTNTRNHGICTCFISNANYGTPKVKDNGVMFGFLNINNNDIPLMGPYDLVTRNSGYTIRSLHRPRFSRLQSILDNTRHTHNETSLERRILNDKGYTELRQPDCVIIFEDMSEKIKHNSIKAYEDFKNSGNPIKLVYINRKINMNKQIDILDKEVEEYKKTYNIDLLEKIINRHNSNRSSTSGINIDIDKSFRLENIINILNRTLDYIEENNDYELLIRFIEVLEKEDNKYNMIKDIHSERQRTFKAYNLEIKNRIKELKDKLNQKKI